MNQRLNIAAALRHTSWGLLLVAVVIAFTAGFLLRGPRGVEGPPPQEIVADHDHQQQEAEVWTCAMDPQIRRPKPGLCPLCGMELIPVESGGPDSASRELRVGENAAALMDIETTRVERRFVAVDVRMVGTIEYDETRLSAITAWVPGRLDRLFVDYTGIAVRKGDHMVSLYSPELLSAQQELLQALRAARELRRSDVAVVREATNATVEAVRAKLRLWGLTDEQVLEIERRGSAEDHVTIHAPSGGIVVDMNAREGTYVNTGTRIYTIADLSHLWVNLQAYESDLAWLRYGQPVEFTTEAYPGDVFTGTISFIHPVLDEKTRTVKVRVHVSNENGRLKPGMFVRALAHARVATEGRVMEPSLAGKWISPMHPEVVKDGPGSCDVCGMPLVRAESLGYVGGAPRDEDRPLVIPATAPLLTGKRAVVYVQVPTADTPTFEGRDVRLGPRAGDFFVVKEGLSEGELVVSRGAFKIDAELQIQARPSMMSIDWDGMAGEAGLREGGEEPSLERPGVPQAFATQFEEIVARYLDVQTALAGDDAGAAGEAAGRARQALGAVDMELLSGEPHRQWMKSSGTLSSLLRHLSEAGTLEQARAQFALLSEEMISAMTRFGGGSKLYQVHCPMAFDGRGALWVQEGTDVHNPYFGAVMLQCGEVRGEIGER